MIVLNKTSTTVSEQDKKSNQYLNGKNASFSSGYVSDSFTNDITDSKKLLAQLLLPTETDVKIAVLGKY